MAEKSKAKQHTEVAEGLAACTLLAGVEAITSTKMSVEFAFSAVWRSWGHSNKYLQVHTTHPRDDIYHQIIGRSERRRGAIAAWRDDGKWLVPYLVMHNWTAEETLDLIATNSGVPAQAWKDLTSEFLVELRARDGLRT